VWGDGFSGGHQSWSRVSGSTPTPDHNDVTERRKGRPRNNCYYR
jgi:hypothetical protein